MEAEEQSSPNAVAFLPPFFIGFDSALYRFFKFCCKSFDSVAEKTKVCISPRADESLNSAEVAAKIGSSSSGPAVRLLVSFDTFGRDNGLLVGSLR